MNKIKVGIIGCGEIARAHCEALSKIEDVKLHAFCDIEFEKAKELASQFYGKAYQDHHEMLEKEDLDAVWICIPPFAHTDQELLCVERGIPFFIEKPVALSIKTAREVNEAVKKKGLLTQVGYAMRFNKSLIEVRRIVKEEGGPIGLISTERLNWWVETGFAKRWLVDVTKSGGALVENITHNVDTMRWIAGDIKRVYARFDKRLWDPVKESYFTIEDACVVVLEFESGTIGSIVGAARAHNWSMRFTIIAKNLQVETTSEGYLITRRKDGSIEKTMIKRERENIIHEEDLHFINSIKQGKLIRSDVADYEEGMKTLEVTLAAVLSAETNQPIDLPLKQEVILK
ncbi:MAG: Gfo/Idh/MocA family oxidoreductase [Candidatus Bathyarchaeia archaeon]